MKKILVLGAGQSAPYLIHTLLENAGEHDWFVTVGDLNVNLARERVGRHERAEAVHFDMSDADLRETLIENADVVVCMMPPIFQSLLATDCVRLKRSMISASYRSAEIRDLERDAERHGVLILCEMGLDPGIDHMSAMHLIQSIQDEGGRITGFCSYGSGIPAPDQDQNPLRYVITWNPRNVVMAGEAGAQYLEDGRIKLTPYHKVFDRTWPVEVSGLGTLEAYANRDALSYMKLYGLEDVSTMVRGTLRYPGWSETWSAIVHLGLPNETLRIPNLAQRSPREVVEMFLPLNLSDGDVQTEERVARYLGISLTGTVMKNLRWLGLFDSNACGCPGDTSADMMVSILREKLPLKTDQRDMVVLKHQVDVEYPDSRPDRRVISTLVAKGEPGGFTAMSKAVGLPAAIGVKLFLTDQLHLTGTHIPTHPSIYEPALQELAQAGMSFRQEDEALD
jgi:saccharopine dehydrogenase-like NADP-dependent oxidoreductase